MGSLAWMKDFSLADIHFAVDGTDVQVSISSEPWVHHAIFSCRMRRTVW